ncbi:DinB family protein [Bacillus sp. PS06]|uniref:DinB family protein n=1 Tax=Bacillus sp. PS06 TaxID=2764176 RepID=UPI001CD88F4B|nr:DinB family protein [Bacillus sp. PS06]
MNKTFSQYASLIDDVLKLKEVPEDRVCEPIKEGKWSIIQIVGHLYYWDQFILEQMVPHMVDGADLPKFPDHDQYNAEGIAFIKDDSVESIIDRFVSTRQELINRVELIGKDVRFTIGGGKRKFSGESYVKMFIKHDAHHLKQMNGKLQSQD